MKTVERLIEETGVDLAELGRLDEALECFERAVALRPQTRDAQLNLMQLLLRMGRVDKAIRTAERGLLHIADGAELHVNLGSVFAARGELEKALHHFDAALRVDPNHREARRFRAAVEDRLRKRSASEAPRATEGPKD